MTSSEVTHLLRDWSEGDKEALDRLLPMVIDEVRDLARRALSHEVPHHTLQPTALVNEAYMRLVTRETYWWKDRSQFFSCLADLMRRVLVDHARRRRAAKRGGGEVPLPLEEGILPPGETDTDLVALDDVLKELEQINKDLYEVVKLWYFVGLTQEEIAKELSISVNTVGRRLKAAKMWLRREMNQRQDPDTD